MAMKKDDLKERAEMMLDQADKINVRAFVKPRDVVGGHEKLNLAFVANMFNMYPNLDPPEEEIEEIIETREEKTYRNWMNSLGVTPRVNNVYSDLADGCVIFQLMDFIKPGMVNWDRVKKEEQYLTADDKKSEETKKKRTFSKIEAKKFQEVLGNCNYVVELCKELNLTLVGISGSDIRDGHQMFILAIVWQLMRAYTISLLQKLCADGGAPIDDAAIIAWANKKLSEAGKSSSIVDFQDKANRNAVPIIDLVDAIKPGTINYSHIVTGANLTNADCLSNAKYAVNMARKIGAPVYALPEDISEVKHKMVMTVYASLMLADNA